MCHSTYIITTRTHLGCVSQLSTTSSFNCLELKTNFMMEKDIQLNKPDMFTNSKSFAGRKIGKETSDKHCSSVMIWKKMNPSWIAIKLLSPFFKLWNYMHVQLCTRSNNKQTTTQFIEQNKKMRRQDKYPV